ncbi:MAG TPA: universal stress protein [SAR202 cluster bacterium]|nr:universal stress protein [SAR202 cluster bacterium]MDP7413049.1 universal stress protein [SAR202 cluster bacterium]HJO82850.1 universal stress protein [SAR202 cluster bacterium]
MLEKILVPLDGSELAQGILPYVVRLARGLNAKLTLFTVVDPDVVRAPSKLGARGSVWSEFGRVPITVPEERRDSCDTDPGRATHAFERTGRSAEGFLREIAERIGGPDLEVDFAVGFGSPAEQVATVAERDGYDLVAMSTHARGTLGRGILGSVTDRVVHSNTVPVMTVRPEDAREHGPEQDAFNSIIVPLDGSILAESALPHAEEIATKLGLSITLVHVVRFVVPSAPIEFYDGIADAEWEELEKEAAQYLSDETANLAAKGVVVNWKLLRGGSARAIVDLVHETPNSLVIMTTRGISGLTRWVLGSVTEKVVRSSGNPVIILPGKAEAESSE